MPHSLIRRIGLALGLEILLALAAIGCALLLAHSLEGKAAAVNIAGSLRMATYRLVAVALADAQDIKPLLADFEHRLDNPHLHAVLWAEDDSRLRSAHSWIRQRWQQDIKPGFGKDASLGGPIEVRARLTEVGVFVGELDAFVGALEDHTEGVIGRLQALQWVALSLAVALGLLVLHRLRRDLAAPLHDLMTAVDRLGSGDLDARSGLHGRDELGRLGVSFDRMAGELARITATLEEQVRAQTRSLAASNRSLELLYRSLHHLSAADDPARVLPELLDDVGSALGLAAGTVCLLGGDGLGARDAGSADGVDGAPLANRIAGAPPGVASTAACTPGQCPACIADGAPHCLLPTGPGASRRISIPITEQGRQYGVLLMQAPPDAGIDVAQTEVLIAVAGHIGMAVGQACGVAQARRLALLEERSTIARELHDSLAQSLSYLKIQVTRLEALWRDADGPAGALPVLAELRDGLNSAYRQLRELLTTFRLKMAGRRFGEALEDTVAEFRQRIDGELRMDDRMRRCVLSPNQQIHALQIVREALANVARHAQARHVDVVLACTDTGTVELRIDDDGIGMPALHELDRRAHHGLTIMRERARSLGGEIAFEPTHVASDAALAGRPGTRMRLRFPLRAETTT
ncbi:MAG: HAMP domain-containing protein [Chromatiales bacterium]|nr:HAMP domain-containing protein [Chromatiales bacterium]